MALPLKHQSIAEFITRLREEYRNSSGDWAVQLASFITSRIQAGDLTDAELRAEWGLTVAQWNQLKTKMNGLVNSRRAIQSAIGE